MNESMGAGGESQAGGLVTEEIKQQAQQAVQQTQQAAGQMAQQATQQATSALAGQKDRAAQILEQTAQALRHAGEDLRQDNAAVVAQIADGVAGRLDSTARYLEAQSVSDLLTDAEEYARRKSTMVLGGAFVLGVIAARFLKSSRPSQSTGGSAGGQRMSSGYAPSSTMSTDGTYDYGTVPYGYEDVSGIPPVDREYSPGLTGSAYVADTKPEAM